MREPVLYSFRRCPFAMRARMALAIGDTLYELREVDLARKPAAMLAASPKGTVPVLVLDDVAVIDQSLSIMRWALARNDPEGWLERDDPDLIARSDGPFKTDLDRYKYSDRYGSDALLHRANSIGFLTELNARLAAAGQLCGAKRGIADAAILPFVRQFAAVDPVWFERSPIPNVKVWLAGHLDSPLFREIMMRFAPWSPDDAAVDPSPASEPVQRTVHLHISEAIST
jgi:glutathione S-transferase